MGGATQDVAHAAVPHRDPVTGARSLFVVGSFGGTADFPTGTTFTARGDEDAFLMRLNPNAPGFRVSPGSGSVTTEAGGTASFTVALNAPPTADVTIPVGSGDTTEGTVSTSSLTFTPANWNVPQTVTITGVDDAHRRRRRRLHDRPRRRLQRRSRLQRPRPGRRLRDQRRQRRRPPPSSTWSTTAATDRTYEYGAAGTAVENYALNGGNTAPRGAASTAAGDKVWVVDANKKVYVYNAAGGLLGSWTAGSLASNATVEGIATNGTDVWIVDARQDKVFRYAGAAGRLSGSQNAASSFSLNSGNTNPKDIVTDGVNLWVVNDATTDKVFKYTLAGVAPRELDDRRGRLQPDRHHARPLRRRAPVDRRQRDRPRLPVRQRAGPHLRLALALDELRPGRRQHQPAGHRRPAVGRPDPGRGRPPPPPGPESAAGLRRPRPPAGARGRRPTADPIGRRPVGRRG